MGDVLFVITMSVLLTGMGLVFLYQKRSWIGVRMRGFFAIASAWCLLTPLALVALEVSDHYLSEDLFLPAACLSTSIVGLGVWFRYFGSMLLPKRDRQ